MPLILISEKKSCLEEDKKLIKKKKKKEADKKIPINILKRLMVPRSLLYKMHKVPQHGSSESHDSQSWLGYDGAGDGKTERPEVTEKVE